MQVVVSSKGQIVLPKEIRRKLGLEKGSVIRVMVQGGKVIIEPVKEARTGWKGWKGALKGSGALEEHVNEHRQEVEADQGS